MLARVLALVACVFCSHMSRAADDAGGTPCLRLGADESLGASYPVFETFFTALYEQAGLCVTSVAMAPKRIEQLLVRGELDGDWFRPSDYATEFSDQLVALPQPVFGLEARLLWLADTPFSGHPEDLKGLTVGHQSGFRWLEAHLPQMGAKTFAVSSSTHVWDLLARRRIDVFATSGIHEASLMQSPRAAGADVKRALWTTVSFYHLLHPRHADKVTRLNAALVQMIRTHHAATDLNIPGIQRPRLADQVPG